SFLIFFIFIGLFSISHANATGMIPTITLRTTNTIVLPNPATTSIGTPIIFHAKVVDSSGGTKLIPSGQVTWSDNGVGGVFNFTSCILKPLNGSVSSARCDIVYTPVASMGPVTITATYSGDGIHHSSTTSSPLTVNLRITKSVIANHWPTSPIGLTFRYVAEVYDASAGSKSLPTGQVVWNDGGAGGTFTSNLCTLVQYTTLSSIGGCWVEYTNPLTTEQITLNATYLGDSFHKTSQSSSSLSITLRPTTTLVSPNPVNANTGVPVTLHAKVIDSSAGTKIIPTGQITWNDGGAGGRFDTSSCTLTPLSRSTTSAICNTTYTTTKVDPVIITVNYSGDDTHNSSSGSSSLTVS
ncbi:MAG TPA: hypothetical protein VLT10_00205, partial [Verrucomicrobiae bacterium]|nr:hypothetical protein [Verrucomicrobiae bacterium]